MDDRTLPGETNDTLPTEEQTIGGTGTAATPGSSARDADASSTGAFRRGPPSSVGGYRLDELLGRGGMGEVHLGYDERLDRRVAVKLLREGRRDQGRARALMEREAKALARLSHPNVVHVYEVGEHDGQIFIAMEYVEGRTLRAFLQHTPRPSWREIVAVFIEAGRGLLAAHEVGIVHRDFKPDNVIIGTDGHPRVLDFGIARLGRDQPAHASGTSQAGSTASELETSGFAGTIRYMPLEQFLHTGEGPAADQFAFCVALYEALWSGDPFPAQALGQRILLIEEEGFVAPPRGQVERAVWPIIRRGLRAKPADRWPDMRALLVALERVLARRRRRALLAAGASLLAVGVVLGGLGPTNDPCADLERELADSWTDADGDRLAATLRERTSAGAATTIRATLDGWYRSWTEERLQLCRTRLSLPEQTHADRLACLDVQRSEVDSLLESLDPSSPPPARAFANLPDSDLCRLATWSRIELPSPAIADDVQQLREQIARAAGQRRAGRLQQSRELLEPARARAHELGFAPLVVDGEIGWGRLLLESEDWQAGAAVLEAATLEADVIGYDAMLADGRELLARAHIELDRLDRARLWLDLARAADRRIDAPPERFVPLTWFAARIELLDGHPERAKELLEPLVAELPATEHPIAYYELLADVRSALGDDEGALQALEQGHARAVRDWGAGHPDSLRMLPNLGLALDAAGRIDEAQAVLEQAVAGLGQLPNQPDLLVAQMALGKLEYGRGALEPAQRWFLAAERTFTEQQIDDPIQLANLELALGSIALLLDDLEQAGARLAAGERRYREHAPDDPVRASCQLGLGMALLRNAELDEAGRMLESVLAWSEPELAPTRVGARLGLAEIALRQGQLDAAAPHLAELASAPEQLGADDRLLLSLLDELLAKRSGQKDRCRTTPRELEPDLPAQALELAEDTITRLELEDSERRCLGWPPSSTPTHSP